MANELIAVVTGPVLSDKIFKLPGRGRSNQNPELPPSQDKIVGAKVCILFMKRCPRLCSRRISAQSLEVPYLDKVGSQSST